MSEAVKDNGQVTESAEPVVVEQHGRVAVLELNRPDVRNALSPETMDVLLEHLRRLDADPEIGAAVIAGGERVFASGADISLMQHRPLSDVLAAQSSRFWFRLREIELPLVAAVSGAAFGGGCELALACDLVIASETARFSQAEIKVGILPGGGGTQHLARTIGKHKAMELVLTGRAVTAAEGERMGFVNEVTSPDRWRERAVELAGEVAAGPPVAVRLAKQAVLAAEETSFSAGIRTERRLMELAFGTHDRVEGMTAFLDKRKPRWMGA